MKIKIIFDALPLVVSKSGVGYYTQELVQALADSHPDDVELLGYYTNFAGREKVSGLPHAPNISYLEIKVMPGKVLNACRRLGFQLPLGLFTKQRADIFLSTNFVATLSLSKSKQVAVIYDLSFVDKPEYSTAKNGEFLRKWVPRSLKKTNLVVTISNFTKQRIIEVYKVPKQNIYITPIPPAKHPRPDVAIIQEYGLANGFVLFVGTIEPRKNIGNLVRAYSQLDEELRNQYPLVLAGGKGWNDGQILDDIARAQSQGMRIIQTGYIDDGQKTALYEYATLYAQPSHYEGFGMPILEAMSWGKPVVCSDIEVFHEVAGSSVAYFDKNDPRSIARTLSKYLKDVHVREALAKRGEKHAGGFITWDKVAQGLYERLAALVE